MNRTFAPHWVVRITFKSGEVVHIPHHSESAAFVTVMERLNRAKDQSVIIEMYEKSGEWAGPDPRPNTYHIGGHHNAE